MYGKLYLRDESEDAKRRYEKQQKLTFKAGRRGSDCVANVLYLLFETSPS
jgi:hypothetical protein